jgi:hypothetical protein
MAVIVTALAGCDNVTWAGFDVALQKADPPPGSLLPEETSIEEPGLPPLPEGDVVYLVRRESGASASAFALASLEVGGPQPLPGDGSEAWTEHFARTLLPAGSELILFADGARLGTFVAGDSFATDDSLCIDRPRIDGIVELVPGATEPGVYLAVPAARAAGIARGSWNPPEATQEIRNASLNLAGELMNELGTPWPQGTVAALRRDLTLLSPPASTDSLAPPPSFAATFLNEDLLRVGDASRGAWSLFYVARHDGTRYRPTLIRYHLYQRDGKAAPRILAWTDLTGDGQEEILLEVFGARDRWFVLAGQQGGEWRTLLEDPCAPVVEPSPEAPAGN